MKNIHVLPTDQPSRLYLEYGDGDLCLSRNLLPQTSKSNNQHIYITSDEEIKGNDYYIHNNRVRQSAGGEQEKGDYRNCKKIILTTDPTLIADDVQSISYHFLEWFVKNPTCEFVEIESWKTKGEWELVYKIIIPQEKPKQETLEEAAENYGWRIKTNTFSDPVKANDLANSAQTDFIAGANYMAERMYSEEEVKNIAEWSFHFYKTNEFDDSELEEEWCKLLKEKFKKK